MRMRWTVMRKYYWVLKRNVLRSFLNDASEIVRSCSCGVRLFQETGPDTWKPLFPSVIVRVDGTTSWPDVADRRCARPGRDATDVQCLDKYRLIPPFARTCFVSRGFRIAGPTIWNSLPCTVKACTIAHLFIASINNWNHTCACMFTSVLSFQPILSTGTSD